MDKRGARAAGKFCLKLCSCSQLTKMIRFRQISDDEDSSPQTSTFPSDDKNRSNFVWRARMRASTGMGAHSNRQKQVALIESLLLTRGCNRMSMPATARSPAAAGPFSSVESGNGDVATRKIVCPFPLDRDRRRRRYPTPIRFGFSFSLSIRDLPRPRKVARYLIPPPGTTG